MSKLKLFRQSGEPVSAEAREAYLTEWRILYDKAAERSAGDILKLNRFLSFLERRLIRKHGSEIELEIPKSGKAWNKLIEQYQDVPIMLARRQDGKGVVMILMDALN